MATASIRTTRDLFLWCMSVIYLFAFTSLFVQIPGLYGDNGILPAKLVLQDEAESFHDLVSGQPTFLRLLPKIGFDVQTGLDFLCLGGAVLSFVAMISRDQRNCVVFTALWTFYLSVFQVGQAFLWFQWDVLLLEVGFLTILVAPVNFFGLHDAKWHHAHDRISFWLVRWLLFRFVFAAGVSKLTAEGQESWWSLAGVAQYSEIQYLPTPIAWYFHQLPEWVLKLVTVTVLTVEVIVPLFMLSPIRHHRIFAFYSLTILMSLMTLLGNYGFFTLFILILSLSLVDDEWIHSWTGQFVKGRQVTDEAVELGRWTEPILSVVGLLSYVALLFGVSRFFNLEAKSSAIESSIGFDADQFEFFVRVTVIITTCIGALSLVWQIISTTVGSYRSKKLKPNQRTTEMLGCMALAVIAASLFGLSLVPHADINKNTQQIVPDSLRNIQTWTSNQYHLINPYFFVNNPRTAEEGIDGRREVVLEGSYSLQSGWKEYNFKLKPGDESSRLPIASPHHPRVDFQMWFAARRSYKQNHWLLNLAYRLLTQQKEVLELLGDNPFPDHPPKYIKASLYVYQFTSNNKDSDRYSDSKWWIRERVGDYLPVVSLEEPSFNDYVRLVRINTSESEDITTEGDTGAERQSTSPTTIAKTATVYVRSVLGQGCGSCACLLLVIIGFLLTLLDPANELFKVPVSEIADGLAHFNNNNCVK